MIELNKRMRERQMRGLKRQAHKLEVHLRRLVKYKVGQRVKVRGFAVAAADYRDLGRSGVITNIHYGFADNPHVYYELDCGVIESAQAPECRWFFPADSLSGK